MCRAMSGALNLSSKELMGIRGAFGKVESE
jgi:hypothetical protein